MRKEFLAVFSGFPDHHFSEEITRRLRKELTVRKSIVFITACPLDYEQNDDDCDGMYEMFAEQGLQFEKHCVIDKRTKPEIAKELVENADCIFLMGGGVCEEQLDLIREKGCYDALINCHAAIFGVSAGSMNMAWNTVDFFESMEPFQGLGFTNITVSCHHNPEDKWRYGQTLKMSETRTVYAMEDMSAFFFKGGKIDIVGKIYRVENRELRAVTEKDIKELEQEYQVKKMYSLEDCTFTPVSGHEGGRNQIVIVSRDGEKQYVLRISVLGDRSETDYLAETEFVHFLAENGAPVADVVPSVRGRLVECMETDGKKVYVSLFAYAKGMLIADNSYRYREGAPLSEYFYNAGKALGAIHRLSKSYVPVHTRSDYFDKYNMTYLNHLIPDEFGELKTAIAKRLEKFRTLSKDKNCYGLVHFDFSDGNYHIDMDTGCVTVFDFDNCMNCWYMFDLANLWIHNEGWTRQEPDPGKRFALMQQCFDLQLQGYKTETNLPEEMLEKLPLFIDMVLIENIVDELECCAREGEEPDYEDIEDVAECLIHEIPYAGIGQQKMNNTYIIREAVPDDAEKMILYLNQVNGESDNLLLGKNEFNVPVEGVKRKLAMSKDSQNSIVLIALENEQIIARAELEGYYPARIRHRAKFAISVRKDYWNQGIGTEMLKRIIEQAKEMKIRVIELEVISDNARGINLYHKMGFVDIGIYKDYFYVNEKFKDAVVMQKLL